MTLHRTDAILLDQLTVLDTVFCELLRSRRLGRSSD